MGPRTPGQRRQTEAVSCDELFQDSQVGTPELTLATSLLLHPEFSPSLNNQATLFPNHHHRDCRALPSHSGDSAISLLRNCPWLPISSVLTPLPGIPNGLWWDPKLPLFLPLSLLPPMNSSAISLPDLRPWCSNYLLLSLSPREWN